MDDTFKIFVHRLRDGHSEKIAENLDPSFLEVHEAELAFKKPVIIKGTAECADETLVVTLQITTEAEMPCAICNCPCSVSIHIPYFCHTVPLIEIRGSVFDYRAILREAILLELPYRAECEGGCSERATMAKYLANQGENHGSPT